MNASSYYYDSYDSEEDATYRVASSDDCITSNSEDDESYDDGDYGDYGYYNSDYDYVVYYDS